MPWKETDPMQEKEQFITEMMKGEKPFKHLCAEYGIAEKTGYKWKNRFLAEGKLGLNESSRRPKTSPQCLPEDVIIAIIRIKNAHPTWGPKKILSVFERSRKAEETPSLSSVKRILDKADMVKHRKIRKAAPESSRLRNRILPEENNDVWAIDFKGWWRSDGEICEPLTIRDLHSRFILEIRLMEEKTSEAVRKVLTEVFRKYGLPKVIRSDNGTPFASTSGVLSLTNLSAWWITLGIIPDRTDKGKPGQNGSLERMHADIANEIQHKIPGGRRANQAAIDVWREEYNSVRPNEAIGMKVPAQVYSPSSRKYSGDFDDLDYPPGFLPRKVLCTGVVCIHGLRVHVGYSLRGLTVGLKLIQSGKFHVFLADFLLGFIDTDLCCFYPIEDL